MAKKYEILEDKPCMVSEAARVDSAEVEAHDMEGNLMPCTFTDEEFKEELLLSEASGFVNNEEFKRSCLEKWGVTL